MTLIHDTLNSRNALADQIGTLVDAGPANGRMRIMQGTQQSPGSEIINLPFQPVAFGTASNGTINLVTLGVLGVVVTPGTAGHFRLESGNSALILTGSIGVIGSGADLEFNTLSFANGANVSLSSFSYTASN